MLMPYPYTPSGLILFGSDISTTFSARPSGYVNARSADDPLLPSAAVNAPSYRIALPCVVPSLLKRCTTTEFVTMKFVCADSVQATAYDEPSHTIDGVEAPTTFDAITIGVELRIAPFGSMRVPRSAVLPASATRSFQTTNDSLPERAIATGPCHRAVIATGNGAPAP